MDSFLQGLEWIGKYKVLEVLKHSEFQIVHKVENPVTKDVFVIKTMKRTYHNAEKLQSEKLNSNLNMISPFLVTYFNVYEDKEWIKIRMEYCEHGDLKHWLLKQNGILDEQKVIFLFAQIVECVSVLHNHSIIHGKIEPENFVLNYFDRVKLTNFSSARVCTECDSSTRNYLFASDVLDIGRTVYYMMTGHMPSAGENVKMDEGKFSYDLMKLVQRMISDDARERPTITELKEHRMLQRAFSGVLPVLDSRFGYAFKRSLLRNPTFFSSVPGWTPSPPNYSPSLYNSHSSSLPSYSSTSSPSSTSFSCTCPSSSFDTSSLYFSSPLFSSSTFSSLSSSYLPPPNTPAILKSSAPALPPLPSLFNVKGSWRSSDSCNKESNGVA